MINFPLHFSIIDIVQEQRRRWRKGRKEEETREAGHPVEYSIVTVIVRRTSRIIGTIIHSLRINSHNNVLNSDDQISNSNLSRMCV